MSSLKEGQGNRRTCVSSPSLARCSLQHVNTRGDLISHSHFLFGNKGSQVAYHVCGKGNIIINSPCFQISLAAAIPSSQSWSATGTMRQGICLIHWFYSSTATWSIYDSVLTSHWQTLHTVNIIQIIFYTTKINLCT